MQNIIVNVGFHPIDHDALSQIATAERRCSRQNLVRTVMSEWIRENYPQYVKTSEKVKGNSDA